MGNEPIGTVKKRNMSNKVHEFTLDNTLYSDTRVPYQYRGGGRSNTKRAFELSALVTFVLASVPANPLSVQTASVTSGSPSIAVSAGRLVSKIVVIGGSSGTFNLGTGPGGDDILAGENYDTDGAVYVLERYFGSSGTLYFDGFSGTLTVKLILINLT